MIVAYRIEKTLRRLHNFNAAKNLVRNEIVYAVDALSSSLASMPQTALQSFCELTHFVDKRPATAKSSQQREHITRQWLDYDSLWVIKCLA